MNFFIFFFYWESLNSDFTIGIGTIIMALRRFLSNLLGILVGLDSFSLITLPFFLFNISHGNYTSVPKIKIVFHFKEVHSELHIRQIAKKIIFNHFNSPFKRNLLLTFEITLVNTFHKYFFSIKWNRWILNI